MTHVIEIKRMPWTAVRLPVGWLVFRSFAALVYRENDPMIWKQIAENIFKTLIYDSLISNVA